MPKVILIPLILFGLIVFAEDILGQGVYKSVDEKGTISFSDNPKSPVLSTKKRATQQVAPEVLKKSDSPASPVIKTEKEATQQDATEVLKRNETANRRPLTDSEINNTLLSYPTWRGSTSSSPTGSTS